MCEEDPFSQMLHRYINSKQRNQSDITQLQITDGTMTLSDAEASEELNCFLNLHLL